MHTGLLAADAWKRERKKPRLKKERCKPEKREKERSFTNFQSAKEVRKLISQ